MAANEMVCMYCGQRIVWREAEGWLVSTDEHRFGVHFTETCQSRPDSEGGIKAGHRLLEPEPDPDPLVPRLDPKPWLYTLLGDRSDPESDAWREERQETGGFQFWPRKGYSQVREDYP